MISHVNHLKEEIVLVVNLKKLQNCLHCRKTV
jgi:hypothetical protein